MAEPIAPDATRRSAYVHRYLAFSAVFGVAAIVEASLPRLRSQLVQLPIYAILLFGQTTLNYVREFHPSRLPRRFPANSHTSAKLKRTGKWLFWGSLAVLLVIAAAVKFGACGCDTHPLVLVSLVGAMIATLAASLVLSVYIALRSEPPGASTHPRPHWPGSRTPIAEYKPFQSDHWGKAHVLSTTQTQDS